MARKNQKINAPAQNDRSLPLPAGPSHSRIVAIPDSGRHLDPVQLAQLEQSFRAWAEAAPRLDVRLSRRRILLIFLMIRYTGARLNEVFALNPFQDLDPQRQTVVFGPPGATGERPPREVQLPEIGRAHV